MDGSEADRGRAEPHGRRPDVSAAEIPLVDDPAVLDVDERPQLVGFPEAIGLAERLEVVDLCRWRLVVVGDAKFEWDLRQALDGLGRDPGDRGHAGFVTDMAHVALRSEERRVGKEWKAGVSVGW